MSPIRTLALIIGICCIALSVLAGVVAVFASEVQPSSQSQAMTYAPIVPELSLPRAARSYLDVQYCQTNNPRQALDVFSPKAPPNYLAPALIYVHGGGWSHSSKRAGFLEYYKASLLEQGIAVVAVNHRLAPQHIYPDQNNDIACAIDFIYQQAARFGIDRQRLALFGESSGAQLITAVALDPANDNAAWKPSIRAVIPFYGIADFQILLNDPNYRGLARRYLSPDFMTLAKRASITSYNLQDPPNFYIFHGDKDGVIPYNQSILLHQHLIKHGGQSQLTIVRNGGHGFGMSSTPHVEQIRQMMLDNLKEAFTSPLLPTKTIFDN